MEDFKYIKVVVDGDSLIMTFLGNEGVDRDDFLEESIEYLAFEWFGKRMHILLFVIREMIKNIYDHGTGKGILTLSKKEDNYVFELIDHNPIQINFDEICKMNKENGWIKKTKQNCNVGLSIIQKFRYDEVVELFIDDTKGGINYSGSYCPKQELKSPN